MRTHDCQQRVGIGELGGLVSLSAGTMSPDVLHRPGESHRNCYSQKHTQQPDHNHRWIHPRVYSRDRPWLWVAALTGLIHASCVQQSGSPPACFVLTDSTSCSLTFTQEVLAAPCAPHRGLRLCAVGLLGPMHGLESLSRVGIAPSSFPHWSIRAASQLELQC